MHLTGIDFFFWAVSFSENVVLLFVLWYRRLAKSFPFFTALAMLSVIRTIVLYCVLNHGTRNSYFYSYGTRNSYFYTYWSLAMLDTMLQLGIVYEIASRVFRPVGVWAPDVRGSFTWMLGLSVTIALGLSWLASPPAPTWRQSFVTRGNLFAAALISELFILMMALSISARLPWRTHAAKIAQGLGAYSLVIMLIETGHSYFGVGEVRNFRFLSHIRIAAYMSCVAYWAVMLWRAEQPSREMTEEMRERLFTLQRLVAYDLQELRSRKKL
jgi:hypothetical protein